MILIAKYAHTFFLGKNYQGKCVVDLTMGNGKDTLFLASLCQEVIAFDIQPQALEKTRALLEEHEIHHVTLIEDDHQHCDRYLHKPVFAAIYNLGYLPGGDKEIKTEETSTIASLTKLLDRLEVGGFVILVVYPRHEGSESQSLLRLVQNLSSKTFDVMKHSVLNKELAPYVIEIIKHA